MRPSETSADRLDDLQAALAEMLPDGAAPTLVTDAGFRNPWFRAVVARG
jgi:hypothetical protein